TWTRTTSTPTRISWSAARSKARRPGCSTSTPKAISSKPHPRPAISRSARASTASRCSTGSSPAPRRWSRRPSARWSRSTRRCAPTSRSPCRAICWSTKSIRCPSGSSAGSKRPIPTSRWCTRNGERVCGACSRSFSTPTGSDMAIRVALQHRTSYRVARAVTVAHHETRLRPAPHCRTPVLGYSLNIEPAKNFLNWQQDPYGNWVARVVFPEPASSLDILVDLVADLTVINPFDFFVEPYSEFYPFKYADALAKDLIPFLDAAPAGPRLSAWLTAFRATLRADEKTVDMLVRLNRQLQHEIRYLVRMEPGVQTPEETFGCAQGSCRDSGWLLVQILRHLGLAARFASGYLIQLAADVKSLDGPSGTERDFTDLHAWAEVYLPGAGWIGLDPTSGL